MTKVVIPPPSQKFVGSDGHVTEPWRQYLDSVNQAVNAVSDINAPQLIETGALAGTQITLTIPSTYRGVSVHVYGAIPSTSEQFRLRASTGGGSVSTTVYDLTRCNIFGDTTSIAIQSTIQDAWYIVQNSVSTVSSAGGIDCVIDLPSLEGAFPRILFHAGYVQIGSTRTEVSVGSGKFRQGGPITDLYLGWSGGQAFTTGGYAIYGYR